MKTEKLCLFYVSKAHLLVIMNEYLKDKEDYELYTFLEEEIKDDTVEPDMYEAVDLDGIIDFEVTKDIKIKKLQREQNKIILIGGSEKYRQEVEKYIEQQTQNLDIESIKIINIYSFEENKLRMSQIFKRNEKILYTVGEEIIEH